MKTNNLKAKRQKPKAIKFNQSTNQPITPYFKYLIFTKKLASLAPRSMAALGEITTITLFS